MWWAATRTFSTTGSLLHTARLTASVLLPNGKVLLPGGTGSDPTATATEIYDPTAGTWSATSPQATLTATDAAKNTSKPKTISFTIVKC